MNDTSRSGRNKLTLYLAAFSLLMLVMAISTSSLLASEKESTNGIIKSDAEASGGGGAAASNPLSAVNNTDLKWTYIRVNDPNDSRRNGYWVKGGCSLPAG